MKKLSGKNLLRSMRKGCEPVSATKVSLRWGGYSFNEYYGGKKTKMYAPKKGELRMRKVKRDTGYNYEVFFAIGKPLFHFNDTFDPTSKMEEVKNTIPGRFKFVYSTINDNRVITSMLFDDYELLMYLRLSCDDVQFRKLFQYE